MSAQGCQYVCHPEGHVLQGPCVLLGGGFWLSCWQTMSTVEVLPGELRDTGPEGHLPSSVFRPQLPCMSQARTSVGDFPQPGHLGYYVCLCHVFSVMWVKGETRSGEVERPKKFLMEQLFIAQACPLAHGHSSDRVA